MHEASLVAALLHQVRELSERHRRGHVKEIRVEVGLLAGVEPLLFSEAFQRLKAGSIATDAELVLESVGLTCHCRGCRSNYVSEELRFVCPACQSGDVEVIAGDAVVLQSVTMVHDKEASITE